MAEENPDEADLAAEVSRSFNAILMHDVIDGLRRAKQDQSQGVKRDLIRTMFAAIEGSVWGYREHVSSIAKSVDELTPTMAMAFSELTYFVTKTGELESQMRFIPLTSMIRFTTQIAQKISPDLQVDFGSTGWFEFQRGIAIRHRITHPKSITDLEITEDDVAVVTRSLFWLLEIVQEVMEATNLQAADYLKYTRNFLAKLVNGDTVALAAYQNALQSLED